MGILLNALVASVLSIVSTQTGGLNPELYVSCSYTQLNTSTNAVTPVAANTTISSATTTNIVTGSASAYTDIQEVTICNQSGFVSQLTIKHSDGTNNVDKFLVTMGIGYTITYDEGNGWRMFDASMRFVTAIGPGSFIKMTVVLNGTTSFTTQSNTSTIRARLLGGGGAGGGCPATSGEHGGGGASGGYAEWVVAVSPSTSYTCAVGAGGTGVSAANGNAGGNTTLTVGGTTCTANGGPGGNVGSSATVPAKGGAAPSTSTNGTVNASGSPGLPAVSGTGAGAISGGGGSTEFGGGALGTTAAGAGTAATGFGSGGSGGYTIGNAETGGAGSNGILIIEEFT